MDPCLVCSAPRQVSRRHSSFWYELCSQSHTYQAHFTSLRSSPSSVFLGKLRDVCCAVLSSDTESSDLGGGNICSTDGRYFWFWEARSLLDSITGIISTNNSILFHVFCLLEDHPLWFLLTLTHSICRRYSLLSIFIIFCLSPLFITVSQIGTDLYVVRRPYFVEEDTTHVICYHSRYDGNRSAQPSNNAQPFRGTVATAAHNVQDMRTSCSRSSFRSHGLQSVCRVFQVLVCFFDRQNAFYLLPRFSGDSWCWI